MTTVNVTKEWCERYKQAVTEGKDREELFDELFSQFKAVKHSIDYNAIKQELLTSVEPGAVPYDMCDVNSELVIDFNENVLKKVDASHMKTVALILFYQLLRHTLVKEE